MFHTMASKTYTNDEGKIVPIPEMMIKSTREVPYPVIGPDGKPVGGDDDCPDWQGFPIKTRMTKRLMEEWHLNPEYVVLDEKGKPTGQLYDFSTGRRTVAREIVMTQNNTVFPTLEMSRAVTTAKRQQSIEEKLDVLMAAIAEGKLVPAQPAQNAPAPKPEMKVVQPAAEQSEKPAMDQVTIKLPEGISKEDIIIEAGEDNDVIVFAKGAIVAVCDIIADDATVSAELKDNVLTISGVKAKAAPKSNIIPLKVVGADKAVLDPLQEGAAIDQEKKEVVNKVPPAEEANFLKFIQINPSATEADFMAYARQRDEKASEDMKSYLANKQ